MSPAIKALFLPKLFPSSVFTLGEFVSHPLTPTVYPFREVQAGQVVDADPEAHYETIVCLDSKGWISLQLTRLIDFGASHDSGNLLSIKADEMRYRTLTDPDGTFHKTVADSEAARKWLSDMALNGKKAYMVVGLQELKNAKFQKAKLSKSEGHGYLTIPLDEAMQLPVKVGGGMSRTAGALAKSTVSGVFGIEVREINLKRAKPGDFSLSDKISWKFSYERIKGQQDDEDMHLYADLGEAPAVTEIENLVAEQTESEGEEDV
jgi:hypothetical protein